MHVRNSGAMVLQDTGGVEGGQPKGSDVNARYMAEANIPKHVDCLHKMLLLSKRGGDTELDGLAPRQPATFIMGGMDTAQSGKCSQVPSSH